MFGSNYPLGIESMGGCPAPASNYRVVGEVGATRYPPCPNCRKDCKGRWSHGWNKLKHWCSKHPIKAVAVGMGIAAGVTLCTLTLGPAGLPVGLLVAGLLTYGSMTHDYVPRRDRGVHPVDHGHPYHHQPPVGGSFPPRGGAPSSYRYAPHTCGSGGQCRQQPMRGHDNPPPQPPLGAGRGVRSSGQPQPPNTQQPQPNSQPPRSPTVMTWV